MNATVFNLPTLLFCVTYKYIYIYIYVCVCVCSRSDWTSAVKMNRRKTRPVVCVCVCIYTVGSRFATVRFTTIHFYELCPVGPSTPDLWCITVATHASFLYLMRFQIFSAVHVFLLILF